MKALFIGLFRTILVVAVATGYCSADDSRQCARLLEHGIFDNLSETGSSNSRSKAMSELCRTYTEYQSHTTAGSASGHVYEVFDGSLSLSDTQIKSIGEWMCDGKYSEYNEESFAALNRSVISPSAVSAWQACVTQSQFISVDTTYHDSDQGTEGVTLSFYRSGSSRNSTEQVNWIKSSPNLTCTSPGALAAIINPTAKVKPVEFSAATLSVNCTRTTQSDLFRAGTRDVYADSGFVDISTSAKDIYRTVPAILPPPPPPAVPRGTIVAWVSTGNSVPAGWAICDGKNGTPNLVDKFLRGTADFSKAGTPGGNDPQRVRVSVPELPLVRGRNDGSSMWASGAHEVFHFTGNEQPDGNVIDAVTTVSPAKGSVDDQPAYVAVIYIMKL